MVRCVNNAFNSTLDVFEDRKKAIQRYERLCEDIPSHQFAVVKRQIIEEIIAESDDCRQQRFEFAK